MSKRLWTGLFSGLGMLMMILDTKTGIYGASEGLRLCIQVMIPSLFPFIFLSILLTGLLAGKSIPLLRPIGRLCGVPRGAEILLLTGMLGGYPSGAQAVAHAWEAGHLSKDSARRMLGFCSNAGPSFLFGIIASQFSNKATVWILWLIHILSSILTAALLPGKSKDQASTSSSTPITLPHAVKIALTSMAQICGWVILSKVMLSFLDRWILWLFPNTVQVILTGILELSNGCWGLSRIPKEGIRFIVCSAMLSFGGICVAMQTLSVTAKLGLGMYLPGKLLQTLISIILGYAFQFVLLHPSERWQIPLWMILIATISGIALVIILYKKKITVAFQKKMMYNPVIPG